MKDPVSLVWIDWRIAGRTTGLQALGRFVLLCLTALLFLTLHLSGGLGRFLSSEYAVTAVLRASASPEEARGLAGTIARLPSVRSAVYRDPAAAWEGFLLAFPGVDSIPGADGNPLPGYIEIRFRHDRFTASDVETVLAALKPVGLVEKVLAGEKSLPRLLKVHRASSALAWGAIAALAAILFVICRLQEQLRSIALAGDFGFLFERGVPERRLAASRAAGAAISGFVLAAVAIGGAAAELHFLLRRFPSLESVVGAPADLLSPSTAAAAGAFVLCAALLFAAASILGWMAVRPSRK